MSTALTTEETRRRREARDTARASGVPFDRLVERYLRNPQWAGGRIVIQPQPEPPTKEGR